MLENALMMLTLLLDRPRKIQMSRITDNVLSRTTFVIFYVGRALVWASGMPKSLRLPKNQSIWTVRYEGCVKSEEDNERNSQDIYSES